MGDAGEGLVDAESKAQERMDELARDREQRTRAAEPRDPARERELQSLRLARTDLMRQQESSENPRRKEQLKAALADVEKRLADLG